MLIFFNYRKFMNFVHFFTDTPKEATTVNEGSGSADVGHTDVQKTKA
jgi:hypothetical protein